MRASIHTSEINRRRAAHIHLRRRFPRTGICEDCGRYDGWGGLRTIIDLAFQGVVGGFSRDIADYRELCRACHATEDSERKRKEITE